ncbi:hypothetical protein ABZV91_10350 [Nocardia sp. NPDC004568]|uniref:hypothetical protein n=1 Tax=Nocardia sp. NPDC004568 TaxID=3154551 RepID=UPI0033BEAB3C
MGDEWYHRRKGNTHGGIWVGDAHILDLGHPVINRDYEYASHIEGAAGVYQRQQRALLIGNGQPASHNGPLHEYGHGADHSLGDASKRPNYQEVHEATIRVLDNSEYEVVREGANQ